jgi:adenylylsulfate kinase
MGFASGGVVVWVTGPPQSGKSTFAGALADELRTRGRPTLLLDGDEVRHALVPEPAYDPESRDAFYATLANLAAVMARQGFVVVVAATAHLRKFRTRAKEAAGGRYFEVQIAATPEQCRARDRKGLYSAAASGSMPDLPGRSGALAYEPSESPDIFASGGFDEAARYSAAVRVLRFDDR